MTDRIAQLDAIVAQFDLNTHPFYQDWRMGTLPVEKLRDYAAEYAKFVDTIDEGWDTVGMPHYAEEEREHEVLWANFRREIGSGDDVNLSSTETLVTAARNLMRTSPEAYGALYAFEAQQPNTSKSKLDGLVEHYNATEAAKEYFEVHALDFNEVEDLRKAVANLSDEEFARVKNACAVVCSAMWGALDGIYYSREVARA